MFHEPCYNLCTFKMLKFNTESRYNLVFECILRIFRFSTVWGKKVVRKFSKRNFKLLFENENSFIFLLNLHAIMNFSSTKQHLKNYKIYI